MAVSLVPQFGWPPYLSTKLAAAYTGKSRWGIYRAVKSGELAPVSRRGREMIFRREDIDAYLTATPIVVAPRDPHKRTRPSAMPGDALARLRAIKGGGK